MTLLTKERRAEFIKRFEEWLDAVPQDAECVHMLRSPDLLQVATYELEPDLDA